MCYQFANGPKPCVTQQRPDRRFALTQLEQATPCRASEKASPLGFSYECSSLVTAVSPRAEHVSACRLATSSRSTSSSSSRREAPSTKNKQQATELPFSPPTQLRVPSSQSLSKDRTDDLLRLLRLLLSNIHPHLLQLLFYGYRLLSGLTRQHARLQRKSRPVPTIPTLL